MTGSSKNLEFQQIKGVVFAKIVTYDSVVYTENVFVKNVVKESNLVVQVVDPKQRENVSGPTAAIFFFSLFEELSEVYFTDELRRLQEFMGHLPSNAKIPVVFGVFTTLSITVEMFLEKVDFLMRFIIISFLLI